MHPLRSIRRLALGAALAGAAVGLVPAMASAASTCLYNTTTKQVTVEENVNAASHLRITRSGNRIAIGDGIGPDSTICTNQVDFFTVEATVFNTDRIVVNSPNKGFSKVVILEQLGPGSTQESDGVSEIETLVTTTNPRVSLEMRGSFQRDAFRVGATGINFGLDAFATDNDVDVQTTMRPRTIILHGEGGDDQLSGIGNFANPQPTDVPLVLYGGLGNDYVEGGRGPDYLSGGGGGDDVAGNDRLFSNDGQLDELFGGPGFDTAITDATERSVKGVEKHAVESVGHLRLAPRAVQTRAGQTARLTMSWKHPKAWRQLRSVELSLHRGKEAVGTINARPGSGRLTGTGAVDLMSGSRLGHRGKWVTAKLALRVPQSLAGEDLRLDVRATDRDGRRQLERAAGSIRVAN